VCSADLVIERCEILVCSTCWSAQVFTVSGEVKEARVKSDQRAVISRSFEENNLIVCPSYSVSSVRTLARTLRPCSVPEPGKDAE
jgi:hypothetical protein